MGQVNWIQVDLYFFTFNLNFFFFENMYLYFFHMKILINTATNYLVWKKYCNRVHI